MLAVWLAFRHTALQALDLGLFDETQYLLSGWQLLHGQGLPSLDWGPLYAAWYALFHLTLREPVGVYFAQWLATDLAVTGALYALARRLGLAATTAALCAFAWLALPVTQTGWPRVGFFALLCVLLGALLSERRPAFGGLGLLLAAAVRPEYLLPLGLWSLGAADRALPRAAKPATRAAFALLILGGGLFLARGPWGGGRAWLAFSQHHALAYAEAHPGVSADPWSEHARLTREAFPHSQRLSEAVFENPRAVADHLARNLGRLPWVLGAEDERSGHPVGWVLTCAALFLTWRARRRLPAALWAASATALPSLLAAAKPVYLLPLTALLVLGAAHALDPWVQRRLPHLPALAPTAVVASLVALAYALAPPPAARPFLTLVDALREVRASRPPEERWQMLEGDGGYCAYLDPARCTTLHAWEVTAPFTSTLSRVNAVLVSGRLSRQTAYASDPAFHRFTVDPEPFGFHRVSEVPLVAFYLRR